MRMRVLPGGGKPTTAAAVALTSLAVFVVGASPLAQARATDDGPTTPILDDFNRPNENPVSQGGKWHPIGIDGGQRPKLQNTQLHAPGNATRMSRSPLKVDGGP